MKRLIITIFTMYSSITLAGVGEDLNKFFDNLGYANNVTSPHSFNNQQGGYYSNGSLMLRGSVENASMFEVMPPNYSFGCGAIDLFGGAFSFINKEQFLALVNNIGKQSIAFGIQIAMQTAAPQIKSVLDQLMGAIQDMNSLNINSCNSAASLLGGILPKTQATSSTLCESIGISKNKFSDYAAARQGCGADGRSTEINQEKNDGFKDLLGEEYNLAWKSLNNSIMFSSDRNLAELFMSISGSVIMKNHGKQASPEYLMSLATNDKLIGALVNGGQAEIYQCDKFGSDECLNPRSTELIVAKESAILYKVQEYINKISRKVLTEGSIAPEEKAFVNSTYFPILKIIAVESAFKEGQAPISADEIAEIIAYDIVLQYLTRVVDLTAYAAAKLQSVQLTGEPFKEFSDGINQVRKLIYQKRHGLFAQLNATFAVIERTSQIEKQLHDLFMPEESL
ncbi:MAG: conjugal transfer protein TraH [Gammaproteobacteria bacterium]